MKIIKITITTIALLFSLNTSAHVLHYNLNLATTYAEDSAFGGVLLGNVFQGNLSIDRHKLQEVIDDDGSDSTTVIMPLTSYDFETDSEFYNLEYSFNVGNYDFTHQTAGFFESEFIVDDYTAVDDVTSYFFNAEDDSFHAFDMSFDTLSGLGIWSATDADGLVVSGTISAVPVPAAVWMFGSAIFGLAGLKRRKA